MLTFLLVIDAQLITGTIVKCQFKHHRSLWGFEYGCVADSFETFENDRTVTEIQGVHEDGLTNEDVELFLVEGSKLPFLPINVGYFFKNLKTFYVMKSGVTNLTNEDLKGLDKLHILDVSHNPIERIEKGFFDGKSTLNIISFFECALKFVDSEALDPLVNLHEAHFQYNHCVDYRGDAKHLIPILKSHLKNCDGTEKVNISLVFPKKVEIEEDEDYKISEDEIRSIREIYLKMMETQCGMWSSTKPPTVSIASAAPSANHINFVERERELSYVQRNANSIIFVMLCIVTFLVVVVVIQRKNGRLFNQSMRLGDDEF